ncbi:hypothetical protein NDU88_004663 [Pleurodeles waltl]|uniref:Uncharacterized protein n=1 Tax=Pleurodeles waltl TaxID=8319 RepID=A0AAV7N3N3_PLEWA|nr:hypothetical protein NDU88_004663 [Pleurodeles waltl]
MRLCFTHRLGAHDVPLLLGGNSIPQPPADLQSCTVVLFAAAALVFYDLAPRGIQANMGISVATALQAAARTLADQHSRDPALPPQASVATVSGLGSRYTCTCGRSYGVFSVRLPKKGDRVSLSWDPKLGVSLNTRPVRLPSSWFRPLRQAQPGARSTCHCRNEEVIS